MSMRNAYLGPSRTVAMSAIRSKPGAANFTSNSRSFQPEAPPELHLFWVKMVSKSGHLIRNTLRLATGTS